MCRAIRNIAFFWHSRQKKEDNPKYPHLKLYKYLKSEYLALWALIVISLSKSSREWCHPQSDVTKIRSQTRNDQPGALFGYFYSGQPIWIFCPSNKYVGKVVPYLIPSGIRGVVRGGPWTPLGPVLPERFREGTSSEGSKYHKQALSSDSPTWSAPTPPPPILS